MRGAALLLWLVLAGSASAQGLPSPGLPPGITPADKMAIQDVIQRQLNAFQHDDADGAYAFAAPNIKQIFPDAGVFLDMVRRGYPPVYRPKQREFSELGLRDGELVQEVELVGPDGRPILALYTMEKEPDGHWAIAGCTLIPSARLGV
jgi:hypothetical protein